ncbi:hypothetical protein [Euzebya tangerina]|uniref:hypothetical protein n=1 Tax=Euzebya tangerina TaxID=591198 RepID=UPI000E313A14|nr:hypothetical protein [Euzebya tangerina]
MNQPPDIAEQLAAFLAGELDDDAAAAVQARIDGEPWVAELADQTADMLMGLGQVDQIEPAPGYEDRLRAAVAQELGRPVEDLVPDARSLATAAAAATGWATEKEPQPGGSTGAARATQSRQDRTRTGRFLAIAAGFALVAVAAVGTLVSSDFGSGDDGDAEAAADTAEVDDSGDEATEGRSFDSAASDVGEESFDEEAMADEAGEEAMAEEEAVEDEAMEDEAMDEEEPADDGDQALAQDEAVEEDAAADAQEPTEGPQAAADATGADQTAAAAVGPQQLTLGSVPGGVEELRTLVADAPAATALLGTPVDQVAETAENYLSELLRAQPYADGTPAGQCLEQVLTEAAAAPLTAEADLVPAVAARVDLPAGPSIAFAMVRSANGTQLDRVDVYVVDAADCTLRQVLGG